MRFAKNTALIFSIALGLASAACESQRYHREFPPRVDRYLVDEFSRGARGLAETGSMFFESTSRDCSNTYSNLTEGLPSYLGNELWQKPQDLGSSLADMGSREWNRTKQLPSAIWDFLDLLFGI